MVGINGNILYNPSRSQFLEYLECVAYDELMSYDYRMIIVKFAFSLKNDIRLIKYWLLNKFFAIGIIPGYYSSPKFNKLDHMRDFIRYIQSK